MYYVTPSPSIPPRIPYGNREVQEHKSYSIACDLIYLLHMQTLTFTIAPEKVHQMLNTSVSESFDMLDIVHTVVFPEGRTLGVTVEYDIITSGTAEGYEQDLTIEAIELNPFTDATV